MLDLVKSDGSATELLSSSKSGSKKEENEEVKLGDVSIVEPVVEIEIELPPGDGVERDELNEAIVDGDGEDNEGVDENDSSFVPAGVNVMHMVDACNQPILLNLFTQLSQKPQLPTENLTALSVKIVKYSLKDV